MRLKKGDVITLVKEDFNDVNDPLNADHWGVTKNQYLNGYDCPGCRAVKRIDPNIYTVDRTGLYYRNDNRIETDAICVANIEAARVELANGAEKAFITL